MATSVLDAADEVALDEAVGLCADPSRQAELIRWLGRHPQLAGELAMHLADANRLEAVVAPRRLDSPDHRTLPYTGSPTVGDETSLLEFGDFELLGELGRGGMGVVYKARHTVLNKIVALKTVLASGFPSQRELLRFRYEAAAAARLDHPNIVPIYGIGDCQGMPFFSMKYISGGTLGQAMAEQRRDLKTAAALMAKVARAVQFAHDSGIIHRDLKPGNILLENGEPMIADFGLAKALDADEGLSSSGAIVGTPAFMAPEQARADKGWTTASDTYSLGAILYQLLTGRPPFQGDTRYETLRMVIDQVPAAPITINPDAPPDLAAICMKCLEKKAEDRYAHADDLAKDLENFSLGESVSVRPRSLLSQIGRAIGGRRNEVPPAAEAWFALTVRSLLVVAACHGSIFGVIVCGGNMAWVWAVLIPYLVFILVSRMRLMLRSRTFDKWERLSAALWTGQSICVLGLCLAMLPFDSDATAERILAWYPPLSVLFALTMFVQGSINLGAYFPNSILYLALAIVLRYCGPAAPLVFLAVHVPVNLILARYAIRTYRIDVATKTESSLTATK